MKRDLIVMFLAVILLFPSLAQSQPDKLFERFVGPLIQAGDLRILQLEMSPDPVRVGQGVTFYAVISNQSRHSGRVNLILKDRDETVAAAREVMIRPGENRVSFPQTNYRFERKEYCFTVEVDIEGTRRPVDVAKEFCARRTPHGWSMTSLRVGPLFVEDLDMSPDPAVPGQDIRFRARIRNDGNPIRADVRIQDRDQTVAERQDAFLPRGRAEIVFPPTRYSFQRFDHCFTVIVDVERTPYRADAAREFCARPYGWSLRP
jgi:hypothetical protein